MKFPTISLKKTLKVNMNDAEKRFDELNGLDKDAFRQEYSEWFEAKNNNKDQPHVLYADQIVIEQL